MVEAFSADRAYQPFDIATEFLAGTGSGRGKRGGVRVIYYARSRQGEIWMLTLYAKNVSENIPAHILKEIKDEIDV